jgi:hypothetical protein
MYIARYARYVTLRANVDNLLFLCSLKGFKEVHAVIKTIKKTVAYTAP